MLTRSLSSSTFAATFLSPISLALRSRLLRGLLTLLPVLSSESLPMLTRANLPVPSSASLR